ncbi:MAG: type II toxin-antitoxin system RelE/ParE family toxin [Parachlamydiaceae bacterium]|nr:MAG: type II toxin-antitoxin system RelE/ParE family toxin [Parachlamydiaceae bacterium]
MIQSFADEATEDFYNGINSKGARKKLNPSLYSLACRKLDILDAALHLDDLKAPPANRLEVLKGSPKGKHSICINDQYRIVFFWGIHGPEQVEIIDYP